MTGNLNACHAHRHARTGSGHARSRVCHTTTAAGRAKNSYRRARGSSPESLTGELQSRRGVSHAWSISGDA